MKKLTVKFQWARDTYDYDHNNFHIETIDLEGVEKIGEYTMYDYLTDSLGDAEVENLENGFFKVTAGNGDGQTTQYYGEFFI